MKKKGKKAPGKPAPAPEKTPRKRGWPKGKKRGKKAGLPKKGTPERAEVERTAEEMGKPDANGWLPTPSKLPASAGWRKKGKGPSPRFRTAIPFRLTPEQEKAFAKAGKRLKGINARRGKQTRRAFFSLKEYFEGCHVPPSARQLLDDFLNVKAPQLFEAIGRIIVELLVANLDRFAKEFDFSEIPLHQSKE